MELWKDVVGYEKYYQVSSFGNIKNKSTGKLLKPALKKNGYLHVSLGYKDTKTAMVHRLVAEAFIPNPFNLPQVNHKDEEKTNNNVTNLEWCTAQHNVNYGYGSLAKNTGILQFDMSGKYLRVWSSLKEASGTLGIKYQGISRVCRGKRKSCGGFMWRYLPKFEIGDEGKLLVRGGERT